MVSRKPHILTIDEMSSFIDDYKILMASDGRGQRLYARVHSTGPTRYVIEKDGWEQFVSVSLIDAVHYYNGGPQ